MVLQIGAFLKYFVEEKLFLEVIAVFIPEIIDHEINGFICPYEDLDNWAKTAIKVIDHPEKVCIYA